MDKKKLMEMGLTEEQADAVMKSLDGAYVPKGRLDEAIEARKTAEKLADAHKKALDAVKAAGDPEQLKKDLEAAQKATKEAADAYAKQLAEKDLDFAVRQALSDAHDPSIVSGLLDKTKLRLSQEGKVDGLEDQLKGLRESKAFLFAQKAADAPPPVTGVRPADGKDAGAGDVPLQAQLNGIFGIEGGS